MQGLSFDIQKTKALLVGVSDYKYLKPIKPAMGNIEDFTKLLTDNQLFGLDSKNIVQIINKRNDDILDEINEFLANEDNLDYETLLFYYVGHGIRESAASKELFLTAINTKKQTLEGSAIRFNTVKKLLENSNWQRRVVILDACHSGLAAMSEQEKCFTKPEMDIKGTYVLTSSGDEKSFFDTNARNTFFSGELIHLLDKGIQKPTAVISLEDVYDHLQLNLKQSKPQRKSNFNARDFYIFKNRQFDKAALLARKAESLFQDGQYDQAIAAYREVVAELTLSGNLDTKRINKIKKTISDAEIHQQVKNKLEAGIQKSFIDKINAFKERITQLEQEISEARNKLKDSVSVSEYDALIQKKDEELAIKKTELEQAKKKITELQSTLKKEKSRYKTLLSKNEGLKKEVEDLQKKPSQTSGETKSSSFIEKTGDAEIEMIFVKGGTFKMGSSEGNDDEKPVHEVTVPDFYIGKTPVTQKQWREVMGSNPKELEFKGKDSNPVERVSWDDVQDYIKKLNKQSGKSYQLPSEAQWEFAARGGISSKGYKYSGSNTIEDVAWYDENSFDLGEEHENYGTNPVAQKNPNELGIFDMSGNVYEWCQDKWHENYKQAPTDGSAWQTGDVSYRVIRGGGWYSFAEYCRVSLRNRGLPDYRDFNIGFRLVFVP